MKLLRIVLGVVLFAAETAVLYVWGMRKADMQQENLALRLRGKCAAAVLRQMRRRGELTARQIAEAISGVRVGEFWSKRRAAVSQPERFAQDLIAWMLEQQLLERTSTGYRRK